MHDAIHQMRGETYLQQLKAVNVETDKDRQHSQSKTHFCNTTHLILMQYTHIHNSTLPHLRCSPGESSNAVQRRQELLLHDLSQAHICNLSCEVSGQQDVG